MSIPANLRYTASHEWIRVEADGSLTIGVTDHAQEALGDVEQGQLGLELAGQLGGAAQGDIGFMAEVVGKQKMSEQDGILH